MKERQFPRARVDCLSQEFYGEVLIYDPQRHVGHCLNSTAAAVLKLCNGSNSSSQIARTLSQQLSAPVDETVVLLALDHLEDAHLLVGGAIPAAAVSPTRRVAIRRIGIAVAIVLPLVTSIVAPTPAHAASGLPNGQPCRINGQCCSGKCGTGSRCNA